MSNERSPWRGLDPDRSYVFWDGFVPRRLAVRGLCILLDGSVAALDRALARFEAGGVLERIRAGEFVLLARRAEVFWTAGDDDEPLWVGWGDYA